jgi:hypothetical protein
VAVKKDHASSWLEPHLPLQRDRVARLSVSNGLLPNSGVGLPLGGLQIFSLVTVAVALA